MADPITLIDLVGLSTYTGFVEQKSVPITWANYQALPTAQKNNGTSYYITDKGVIYKNSTAYGEGEANVQADWDQTTTTAADYIKNKPTALSDFTNDTNFITNAVNDLTYYYTKSNTYTQSEVNALISAIPKFSIEIVDSLLIETPSTTTIYLLRNQTSQTQNLYTEYIYVVPETGDPFFEKLGEQTINFKPEALGLGYATCATAAATAAKEATLQDYVLTKNGYVSVKFTYDVPANATLNVNSTGAKSILYKGGALGAGIIKAGDIVTFVYDGTYYQIVSVGEVIIPITYANYQLLSQAEINANKYIITDYPDIIIPKAFKISTLLEAGETTLTITNSAIGASTYVWPPVASNGIVPSATVYDLANHTITYTYASQASDVVVNVVAMN